MTGKGGVMSSQTNYFISLSQARGSVSWFLSWRNSVFLIVKVLICFKKANICLIIRKSWFTSTVMRLISNVIVCQWIIASLLSDCVWVILILYDYNWNGKIGLEIKNTLLSVRLATREGNHKQERDEKMEEK